MTTDNKALADRMAVNKAYTAAINGLAAIVNVHTPDNLYDLDAIPRDPVMLQVQRIKTALDELAALSPQADKARGEVGRIGELIRTQDNRITDQPIFIVQQKRLYAGDPDCDHDRIVWLDGDGEATVAEAARLDAEYEVTGIEPHGWRRAAEAHYWDFVTACFTEQGCKDYLARDGHNLREPRIYAAGSYRNSEWRTVRDYLLATTPQPQGDASPNPDDEASIDKAWQRFQAAVATPQAALAKQTYCLACEYEGPDTGGPCPRCDAPRTRPLTPQARTSADRNAYEGAREDLLDWKGRALRAESRLRSLGWQGVDASEAPAQHTEAPNG